MRLEQASISPDVRIIGSIAPMTGLDSQPTTFFWNFPMLAAESKRRLCREDETIAIINAGMTFTGPSRNDACRRLWGDWLFMVDTDMQFPVDTLEILLRTRDAIAAEHGECHALSGIYPKRELPARDLLLYEWNEERQLWGPLPEVHLDRPATCDAAGAGCLLVSREVIERIVMEQNVPPFLWWGPLTRKSQREPLGSESDDMPFFRRLQLLDPPVLAWYTAEARPGHMARVAVKLEDWVHAQRNAPVNVDL
jgi:hypothetical protein